MKKFWRSLSLACAVVMMSISSVGAVLTANADEPAVASEATVINPIAKYEFKDAENHGKDSMGNYDLEFGRYWVAGGTGELMADGTIDTVNGGVTFHSGNNTPAAPGYCLTNTEGADPFANLSAFTLAFEFQNHGGLSTWSTFIGWGGCNPNGNNLSLQPMASGASLNNVGFNCFGTTAGVIWDNAWFQNCGAVNGDAGTTYQKMVISVKPGGKLMVFVNGKQWKDSNKLPSILAEDWNINSGSAKFAIGAEYNGNGAYSSNGAVRNVQIFDFAMDETSAVAYQTNGFITTDDFSDIKEVLKAEAVFEAEETSTALFETMKTEEMFALLNTAKARLTLSDTSKTDVALTWKKVVKEGERYYAIGEYTTEGMGVINNIGNTVKHELEVLKVKAIGEPVFAGEVLNAAIDASMTNEAILAAINKATVTVTLPNDETVDAEVTFAELSITLGDYVAFADVIVNEQNIGKVQLALDVEVPTEGLKFAPVAKWEFDDPENIGKDSMGKYNLQAAAVEGGDTSNPRGMGTIVDGKLYVDGDDCLTLPAMEDVSDTLDNGFTLNFQMQKTGDGTLVAGDWQAPVGFGFNEWNPTKACWFLTGKNSKVLRMGAQGITKDDKGAPQIYWTPAVANDVTDRMHNVTLSVRPGAFLNVYVDGVQVANYECPADWNVNDANMSFSIGGACVWGNGYCFFKGYIDNVSIYNFAMTAEQSNAYWKKGVVLGSDLNGEVITSISPVPVFAGEVLSKPLNDKLTNTQIINRVNDATANAVLENGTNISVAISWKRIEKAEDGKYYVVGEVDASNIGWACALEGITEIRQEVEVAELDRAIIIDEEIVNGTVVASKEAAKLGETVTFTITPAKGYKLSLLEVDGMEIFADEEGVYSYTITGNEDIEVYAEFEEVPVETEPVKSCKSSMSAAGFLGLFLLPAALFVARKSRKED